jgi:hypothetical protein
LALVKPIRGQSTPHLSLDDRYAIILRIESTAVWQGEDYYGAYLELEERLSKCRPGTQWDAMAAWASTQGATPSTQGATPTDARRSDS